MSASTMRLWPEELRDAARDLGHLSGDTGRVQDGCQQSWSRLDAGWQSYAREDVDGAYRQATRELSLMRAMLMQMAESLAKTAELVEEADRAAAGLFELDIARPAGKSGLLAKPREPFDARQEQTTSPSPGAYTIDDWREDFAGQYGRVPTPEEYDQYVQWRANYTREHGNEPTFNDYVEFRLSWELSGEGQVQWTDADWEAFFYARLAGLQKWLDQGAIFALPMTGAQVLARVEQLNAGEEKAKSSSTSESALDETVMYVASPTGLNLRRGPGLDAPIDVHMPPGAAVTVHSDETAEDGYVWRRAAYTDPTIPQAPAASPDFRPPLGNLWISGYHFGDVISYNSGLSTDDWKYNHPGTDYGLPGGDNQVVASASGIVVDSGYQAGGYGNYVIVEYPADSVPESIRALSDFEEGDSVYIMYGHLADTESGLPQIDTLVEAGDPIGVVGSTGNSTGEHLHVEVRFGEASLPISANRSSTRDDIVVSDAVNNWSDPDTATPVDPTLMFSNPNTRTGWVAVRKVDDSEEYLNTSPPQSGQLP